jgi:hypothetical protein
MPSSSVKDEVLAESHNAPKATGESSHTSIASAAIA